MADETHVSAQGAKRELPMPRKGFVFLALVLLVPCALMLAVLFSILPQPIRGVSDWAFRAMLVLFDGLMALTVVSEWVRIRLSEEPSLKVPWAAGIRVLRFALLVDVLALMPAVLYSAGENAGPTVVFGYALIAVPLAIRYARRRQLRQAREV